MSEMKVWVAFVSTEHDSSFFGVFSTEEKASEAVENYFDKNPDCSARYWEIEVDEEVCA
jgi:hypothetical protein